MNWSGKGFALADVDDAEPAEIAVLRAERSIDDRDVLDQFRAQRLQRTQVSLAVALRALILLDVVHQHLQAAVHAAVIQVEAEAPDFERLAAALVLAGVDAGVQLLQHLVVAGEQRAVEDFGVAEVDGGLEAFGGDDHGLFLGGELFELQISDGLIWDPNGSRDRRKARCDGLQVILAWCGVLELVLTGSVGVRSCYEGIAAEQLDLCSNDDLSLRVRESPREKRLGLSRNQEGGQHQKCFAYKEFPPLHSATLSL